MVESRDENQAEHEKASAPGAIYRGVDQNSYLRSVAAYEKDIEALDAQVDLLNSHKPDEVMAEIDGNDAVQIIDTQSKRIHQ